MNIPTDIVEILRGTRPMPKGIVGLVDDLLDACNRQRFRLTWRGDSCTFSRMDDGREFAVATNLRAGVFRAALARMAALSRDQLGESLSPYGGEGVLSANGSEFAISFSNTRDDQHLELTPASLAVAALTATPPAASPARAPSPPASRPG